MDTIEGNKLIAKFMGGTMQIIPKGGLHGYKEGTELWMCIFGSNPDPSSYLCFDESWEWLMPVVDKIATLYEVGLMFNIFYSGKATRVVIPMGNDLWIETGLNYKSIVTESANRNEAVWQAVVEFIQWYNSFNPMLGQ